MLDARRGLTVLEHHATLIRNARHEPSFGRSGEPEPLPVSPHATCGSGKFVAEPIRRRSGGGGSTRPSRTATVVASPTSAYPGTVILTSPRKPRSGRSVRIATSTALERMRPCVVEPRMRLCQAPLRVLDYSVNRGQEGTRQHHQDRSEHDHPAQSDAAVCGAGAIRAGRDIILRSFQRHPALNLK